MDILRNRYGDFRPEPERERERAIFTIVIVVVADCVLLRVDFKLTNSRKSPIPLASCISAAHATQRIFG